MQLRLLIILLLILFNGAKELCAGTTFTADHPYIVYSGRFDKSDPAHPRFSWGGSTIIARFSGTSITAIIPNDNYHYDVEIDGIVTRVIATRAEDTVYTLATGLAPGAHDLRLVQRNSYVWSGGAVFDGFVLDDGESLLPPPALPSRRIEFCGDSYTAGEGNESPTVDCDTADIHVYANAHKAFPLLVAQALFAEPLILGWPGVGLVKYSGATGPTPGSTFHSVYGHTVQVVGPPWDFSSWIPHLVVVCLGANDFASPHLYMPSEEEYRQAYRELLLTIHHNYPRAAVACVAVFSSHAAYTRSVVNQARADGINAHYAQFPEADRSSCHEHFSLAGHRKIADTLIAAITAMDIDWDSTAIEPKINARSVAADFGGIHITCAGRHHVDIHIPHQAMDITIRDVSGRTLFFAPASPGRILRWSTSFIPEGVYVVFARNCSAQVSGRIVIQR